MDQLLSILTNNHSSRTQLSEPMYECETMFKKDEE